jgi:hypothetical protein
MNLSMIIFVIFITFILINYSSQLSYAKGFNKNIFNSLISKNGTQDNTNISNDNYPDQYYICGYPKQLITNYSFLEKMNCD